MNKEMITELFNICISVNDTILEKEKSDSDLSFVDHYIFQMTSYVISVLHNRITTNQRSIVNAFLLRSLIEDAAVVSMYEAGDIPAESTDLINAYNYIIEYSIYKKYKDSLDGKYFNFELFEKSYKEAKEKYRELMSEKNSLEFKKTINSKLPFLMQEYSYDSIIQTYLEGFYDFYKVLSVLIHPNDFYISYPAFENLNLNDLEAQLYLFITNLVLKYYRDIRYTKTLSEEIQLVVLEPLNNLYLGYATEQKNAVVKMGDLIKNQMGDNTQTYLLKECGYAVESIAVDKTFGFSEIVKCKFKPFIEMIALYNYMVNLPHVSDKKYYAQLMSKHTRIKLLQAYKEPYEEYLKSAFNLYKEKINDIAIDEFKKKFMSQLGFIVEDTSLTKLVHKLIDDVVKDDMVLNNYMKMLYDESQSLSHANGYMISSNTGAFMDYSPAIVFMDMVVEYIINYAFLIYKEYNDTEGNHKQNKFIYDLKKNIKKYKENAKKKNDLDYKFKNFKLPY